MDAITPLQILLDGSTEVEQADSVQVELAQFSKTSAEESGLVNISQGGYILDRSKQLVQRLVAQRRLTPFKFFGRTYLSVRELKEFQKVERLPGRPWGKKIIAATKMAGAMLLDPAQMRHDITEDFKQPHRPVVE